MKFIQVVYKKPYIVKSTCKLIPKGVAARVVAEMGDSSKIYAHVLKETHHVFAFFKERIVITNSAKGWYLVQQW